MFPVADPLALNTTSEPMQTEIIFVKQEHDQDMQSSVLIGNGEIYCGSPQLVDNSKCHNRSSSYIPTAVSSQKDLLNLSPVNMSENEDSDNSEVCVWYILVH